MPKSTFYGLIGAFCLLGLVAAPRLAPAAPVELVKNGDFEILAESKARDWTFSTAKPENFTVTFPAVAPRGQVAQMNVSSAEMSGYFNQTIALQPQTQYRLTALAKLDSGKALIYLHGGSGAEKLDTRIYVETLKNHPLVPWFWKKEWVAGSSGFPHRGLGLVRNFLAEPGKWQPVSITFNSGNLKSVTVSLGAYFEAGIYQFDDVSITAISDANSATQ